MFQLYQTVFAQKFYINYANLPKKRLVLSNSLRQLANIFTWIYLPYPWHFATLGYPRKRHIFGTQSTHNENTREHTIRKHPENSQRTIRKVSENTQRTFREQSENFLRTLREHPEKSLHLHTHPTQDVLLQFLLLLQRAMSPFQNRITRTGNYESIHKCIAFKLKFL